MSVLRTDVAIIGGGLAGATAAAMLGRAGIAAVMIDPRATYPNELRAEKLDSTQAAVLAKTGLAGEVLPRVARSDSLWVAQRDRLVYKNPKGLQYGFIYDDLVNAVRDAIPESVRRVVDKATGVKTGPDRQTVTLQNGDEVDARLVVLATGLSISLLHTLGLARTITDACHSITVAFDMIPTGGQRFKFPALTYYSRRPADRYSYITLFPTKTAMRANFMLYRELNDPWVQEFRADPVGAMTKLMPGLTAITGPFEVRDVTRFRPADLYVTTGHEQPGIVLVGDAFSTSCPAAGTGTGKVFTDVQRLCNVYIPQWLATPGMGTEKVAAFYADPEKQAYDANAIQAARWLKALSVNTSPRWRALRVARYVRNRLRGMKQQITQAPDGSATGNDRAIAGSGSAPGA
jgi:2-polyprenyl-6-methoxyphenol hydroxylase-like FAD-dependent oxidoreductase